MGKHAYLAPSAAHRWLECTASPRAEKGKPDKGSVYASEGTQAHAWAEARLENEFHGKPLPDTKIDPDMKEYVDIYVDRVREIYNQEMAKMKGWKRRPLYGKKAEKVIDPKPHVHIEEKLDFKDWIPRSFGTADCIIEGADTLHVIDLKYGKGVLVDAEENPQLKIYALGALDRYNWAEQFQQVVVHIIQPRIDNFSHAEYSTQELYRWAEEELRPKALEAYGESGSFHVGDHCQFCKAASSCRTRQEVLKAQIEEAREGRMSFSEILTHADEWIKWLKSLQEEALDQALQGEEIPGFKLVEGRSNRRITDPQAVANALIDEGVDPWKPQELQSLTALEKLVGKKKFGELCSDWLVKPEGKPTLVPESDKRPELGSAQNEFRKIGG